MLNRFIDHGFVLEDGSEWTNLSGGLLRLEGDIRCKGGIVVEVRKHLVVLDEANDPLVRNAYYSYNVSLEGYGVVFRYDSPHVDHRPYHHVHRYDVLNGDQDGYVKDILSDEDCPTLGEVIKEAEKWYYDNITDLEGYHG